MVVDTTAGVAVDAITVEADAVTVVETMAVEVAVEADDSMAVEARTITITLNIATATEAMEAAIAVRIKRRQPEALGVEAMPRPM